jgi:hypothetical protein
VSYCSYSSDAKNATGKPAVMYQDSTVGLRMITTTSAAFPTAVGDWAAAWTLNLSQVNADSLTGFNWAWSSAQGYLFVYNKDTAGSKAVTFARATTFGGAISTAVPVAYDSVALAHTTASRLDNGLALSEDGEYAAMPISVNGDPYLFTIAYNKIATASLNRLCVKVGVAYAYVNSAVLLPGGHACITAKTAAADTDYPEVAIPIIGEIRYRVKAAS